MQNIERRGGTEVTLICAMYGLDDEWYNEFRSVCLGSGRCVRRASNPSEMGRHLSIYTPYSIAMSSNFVDVLDRSDGWWCNRESWANEKDGGVRIALMSRLPDEDHLLWISEIGKRGIDPQTGFRVSEAEFRKLGWERID